ncbi:MAG TPA: hypothetical protein VIU62_05085, partial [Chloroflexota bacterium]
MLTLTRRALTAGGQQAADLRVAHGWLGELAARFAPDAAAPSPRDGAAVRREVEALLDELPARFPNQPPPAWLAEKAAHVGVILRRLGDGLYHCYDVPGLPRTNNDHEHFYRQLKAGERRATAPSGHPRRSDTFVVRVGGFAAYATAASTLPEALLHDQLASVPAA